MPQPESVRVLVVDDEEGMRDTLEDLLELNGYAARSAGDGRAALELAGGAPFSVAIVDLKLPDIDGLDLAARLRAPDERTQVVILTGNASVESAVRAVRDQGCDYLLKPVDPEELIRTVGAAADRWLRQAAEEHLRRTERLLEALLEAAPVPTMVLDGDMAVRLWNGAAERVFGWAADDVRNKRLPVTSALDREAVDRVLQDVLRGEPVSGLEVKRHTRDGVELDMRMTAAAVRDAVGGPTAVMVTLEDMTEQRRLEGHLHHVQRLDAVGRLAGGIAHDFNNLLAVIRTEADLSLRYPELPQEVRASLETVQETADRGASLTRQLLTFARRQPMQAAVIDVGDIVSDLERMLRRLLPQHIVLEVAADDDVGSVNVDRGQIEQVLTNLVVNARDAIDGTGRITISIGEQVLAADHSRLGLDSGDWVVISVSDTGIGISEGVRSRIFEPFFTTKGPEAGTGLGLATSYGIVKGMGGLITLESQEGVGTTFYVCLPRTHVRAQRGDATDAEAPPSGSETILLVEDDTRLRDVTRRVLIRQGYSVLSASDGEEARVVLEELEEPPDLVIVDAHLPTGDGRDLIRSLTERYPGLRTLLTSGSFELADRDDVDVPFLEKPYTFEALARAVREALDG